MLEFNDSIQTVELVTRSGVLSFRYGWKIFKRNDINIY